MTFCCCFSFVFNKRAFSFTNIALVKHSKRHKRIFFYYLYLIISLPLLVINRSQSTLVVSWVSFFPFTFQSFMNNAITYHNISYLNVSLGLHILIFCNKIWLLIHNISNAIFSILFKQPPRTHVHNNGHLCKTKGILPLKYQATKTWIILS